MSWTINEQSKTSETQYFDASYSSSVTLTNGGTADLTPINIVGYTSGTISFAINHIPSTWNLGSTLDIIVMGSIGTNNFKVTTLEIKYDPTNDNSTFYVEWAIPLEKVFLRINNNATGAFVTMGISSFRLMTESNGGGHGYISTSGASVGPGGADTDVQYNQGGLFGGDSGSTYDYHATGADPKIFSVGTDGYIGGIQRYCATDVDKSWEDGNCGNSESMLFLPGDFLNNRAPGARIVDPRSSYHLDYSRAPSNLITGQTDANVNTIYATKLIPNGFIIPAETQIQVYSDGSGGFSASLVLLTTSINALAAPTGSGLATTPAITWPAGGFTGSALTSSSSVTSDGLLSATVGITTVATGLTLTNGLIAVSVPIERV